MESTKGFFENFPFPIPFIVSAALALGAGAIVLLPSLVEVVGLLVQGNRPPPTHFDTLWEAAWLAALILITGYILEALSLLMYQVLEGYRLWPAWLQERRHRHHVTKRRKLQDRYELAQAKTDDSFKAFKVPFIEERLDEYPVGDDRVAPTRLGNVMRAMESYGRTHYGLDSQSLWYELTTVAPGSLQLELIRSRQSVDFFVATVYTSVLFGVAAVFIGLLENATGLSDREGVFTFNVVSTGQASIGPLYVGLHGGRIGLGMAHILLGLVVAICAPLVCYRMAIEMAKAWAEVIQALVNLGRIRLADQLHLRLPGSQCDEMTLWEDLYQFVNAREPQDIVAWGKQVDLHRPRLDCTDTQRVISEQKVPEGGEETTR